MKFSVMITTRDRCDELRRTLERLEEISPPPDEILVCADGCRDGTVPMLRERFPTVRLFENTVSLGSVASRDRLLRKAIGNWVLSLDDDSQPIDDRFFSLAVKVIEEHPESSVISLREVRDGESEEPASSSGFYVAAYANCAALMEREFYLAQPGFPDAFEHMYEEPDYALQCYAAGSTVWFEPSLGIRHFCSPTNRSEKRRHWLNARNELWSVWMRCPWPWVVAVSLFRIGRQFVYACTEGLGGAVREPIWWRMAISGIQTARDARRPVPWQRYYTWMRMARRPIRDQEVMLRILDGFRD